MNSQLDEVSNELDAMLPAGLRPSTALLIKADLSEESGTSAQAGPTGSSETPMEVSSMNPALTQAVATTLSPLLTADQLAQIRTMASEEATKIIAAKDSQTQVASTIERLTTEAAGAKAEANQSKAEHTKATAAVVDLQGKLDKVNKDLGDANLKVTAAVTELATEKAEHVKTKASLAELQKKVTAGETIAKIADRKAALVTANIKAESKFAAKAIATNEAGTLKMTDEDFTDGVEDMKQPAATAPAQGTAADGTQQATATDTTTTTTTTAAAPAAPDLSAVEMHRRATAAIVNGSPAPTESGKKKYAAAI